MTIIKSLVDQRPVALYSDDATATGTIPVDLSSNTPKMVRRVVVPVQAGDLLKIDGYSRVTNDCGYTIGVGYHLWYFDVDDGQPWPHGTWKQIGNSNGDNVDPTRHHMPAHISAAFIVPADWPTGHRMTVVFQVDAHSTAWKSGDTLTVDSYGHLTVEKWSTAAPTA